MAGESTPIITAQLAYFDQIYTALDNKVSGEKDSLTEQTRAQVLLGTMQMALNASFQVMPLDAQVKASEADAALRTTQKETLVTTVSDNRLIKSGEMFKDISGMALNADVAVPSNVLEAVFKIANELTELNLNSTTTTT